MALSLAGVSVGLLVFSLKDLTSGICQTSGQHWIFALLLAIGIDTGFVLTKMAQVSVAEKPVAKAIAGLARITVGGLLLLSAFYNCKEFVKGSHFEGFPWEQMMLGTTLPALIFAFSQIAARLWLYGSKRN